MKHLSCSFLQAPLSPSLHLTMFTMNVCKSFCYFSFKFKIFFSVHFSNTKSVFYVHGTVHLINTSHINTNEIHVSR